MESNQIIAELFGVVILTLLFSTVPPAPDVSVTANNDFQSFNVAITTTPEPSVVCVLGYVLNVTEDGGTRTTMSVDTSGVVLVGELNLCNTAYIFTASATTRAGSGDLSDPVVGQVDFSGGSGVISLLLCMYNHV